MAVNTSKLDRELLFSEELMNLAKCGICQDIKEINHLLQCGHSVCANDLTSMFKNSKYIVCPFCKQQSSARQLGDLPRDYHKNELVLLIKKTREQKCVECDKRAVAFCQDDKEFFCLFHLELAHLVGKSKIHKVVSSMDHETAIPLGKISFVIEERKPEPPPQPKTPPRQPKAPPKPSFKFLCSKCDQGFQEQDDFDQHFRWDHFYCNFCQRFFVSEQAIGAHLNSRHSETLECGHCGRTFGSENSLRAHQRSSGHWSNTNSPVEEYYY